MSKLDTIRASVRRTARKVSMKAETIADNALTGLRKKSLQAQIDEQYENLGKLVYQDLHTEEDLEEKKLAVIAAIDALFDELTLLEADEAEEAAEEAPAAEVIDEVAEDVVEEVAAEEAATEEAAEVIPESAE